MTAVSVQTGTEVYQYAVMNLLKNKPFFANLILNMRLIVDNKNVPTAGVNVTDKVNLYINEDFMKSLTPAQACDVLEHECLHVLNNHFERIINQTDNKEYANVCADAAINQYLPHLQKDYITPEKMEKMFGKKLQKYQATEYYYNECYQEYQKMKQQQKGQGGGGGGQGDLDKFMKDGQMDDHGIWEKGSMSESHVKAVVQEAVGKAVEQSGGIGHLSNDIALMVNKLNKNTVNWKTLLKNFVYRNVVNKLKPTRKKPNRRFGIEQPGKKKERIMTLVVCIDTSGSVSDAALTQFYSEIDSISKVIQNVYIIEADSEVKDVKKYNPKAKITVKGRGGTAYQPAITKAMELNPDCIIYFGDMDAADRPIDPKVPFLWAIVGGQKPPATFGHSVKVEVKN